MQVFQPLVRRPAASSVSALSRFHVCVQSLPFAQTVAKNPTYFQQMIWDMAHYANALIRRSNTGTLLYSLFQLKETVC